MKNNRLFLIPLIIMFVVCRSFFPDDELANLFPLTYMGIDYDVEKDEYKLTTIIETYKDEKKKNLFESTSEDLNDLVRKRKTNNKYYYLGKLKYILINDALVEHKLDDLLEFLYTNVEIHGDVLIYNINIKAADAIKAMNEKNDVENWLEKLQKEIERNYKSGLSSNLYDVYNQKYDKKLILPIVGFEPGVDQINSLEILNIVGGYFYEENVKMTKEDLDFYLLGKKSLKNFSFIYEKKLYGFKVKNTFGITLICETNNLDDDVKKYIEEKSKVKITFKGED